MDPDATQEVQLYVTAPKGSLSGSGAVDPDEGDGLDERTRRHGRGSLLRSVTMGGAARAAWEVDISKSNVAVMGSRSFSGHRSKPMTGRWSSSGSASASEVMFAANFALIYVALSTLHGEELENAYDASQVYNQRLAEARAQDELGWTVNVTTRQENGEGVRVVADFRDRDGADRAGPRSASALSASVRSRRRSRCAAGERRRRLRGLCASGLRPGRWNPRSRPR